MLILTICPKCTTEHELTPKLLGDTINCLRCQQPFVVQEAQPQDEAPIVVQSAFAADSVFEDPLATARSTPSRSEIRQTSVKHPLTVPPPPVERWTPETADEPELFPEFDHDSRELRDFLKREENCGDHSWLLAAGLLAATLMVLAFLIWFVYLLVR
jgi:hypothetical protein